MVKSLKLNRRMVLRGMGATLALPALEAMFDSRGHMWLPSGKASAQVEPSKFIVFHWPYGIPHYWQGADPNETQQADFWFPKASTTVQNFTTSPVALQPLLESGPYGNFRSDINIVSGLTLSPAGYDGDACSHGHCTAVFTGMKVLRTPGSCDERPGGPSVDTYAAQAFGESEPLALCLPNGNGTSKTSASYGGDYWRWSAAAASKPNNITWLPSQMLKNVFTLAGMSDADRQKYRAREQSVIDFIKRDAERLKKRLGSVDRARLDQHLDTVRSIEQSVLGNSASGATCGMPNVPPDNYAFLSGSDYEGYDTYVKDMIRLGVLALQCGARRTLFVSLGSSQNDDGKYQNIDPNFKYSIHSCQHGDGGGDIEGHKQWRRITQWQMDKMAYALYQLKGGGNASASILDRSVFVSTSEFISGYHYPTYLPVIVAGKASAMTTGRHIAYANTENTSPSWAKTLPGRKNPCINDLWQTSLRAVGALGSTGKFAPNSSYAAQSLSELWTLT